MASDVFALRTYLVKLGPATATRIPKMPMVTISSIKVKPFDLDFINAPVLILIKNNQRKKKNRDIRNV